MITEIEHRKPIWKALSEFYLDTQLQPSDYDSIAEVLMATPFDLKELKAIDKFEVFPVLKGNLVSVAGEWNGFDEEWLYAHCQDAYEKRNSTLFRWKTKIAHQFLGSITKVHWAAIEQRL